MTEDIEPYEFETKDGKVFSFATEEEMKEFAIEWTIGNLVAEGYGEFIVDENGEKVFKINDKGIAAVNLHTSLEDPGAASIADNIRQQLKGTR